MINKYFAMKKLSLDLMLQFESTLEIKYLLIWQDIIDDDNVPGAQIYKEIKSN